MNNQNVISSWWTQLSSTTSSQRKRSSFLNRSVWMVCGQGVMGSVTRSSGLGGFNQPQGTHHDDHGTRRYISTVSIRLASPAARHFWVHNSQDIGHHMFGNDKLLSLIKKCSRMTRDSQGGWLHLSKQAFTPQIRGHSIGENAIEVSGRTRSEWSVHRKFFWVAMSVIKKWSRSAEIINRSE